MLTVYGTSGLPGTSTPAVYLAAHWASQGKPVLLIEVGSAAGSLSQTLGMRFTPGTASFVASGKPATAAELINHAQDVLFSDLHVMPAPVTPSGAAAVSERFCRMGEELRDVSDSGELAVVVDAGRVSGGAGASELTLSAAGVLVVTHGDENLASLAHLSDAVSEDADAAGPRGLVMTIGASPHSSEEWSAEHGLCFAGSLDVSAEHGANLSIFMPRGKRKSRRLVQNLADVAERLYEYAHPPSAATPRPRLPLRRPGAETAGDEAAMAHQPPPEAVSPSVGHQVAQHHVPPQHSPPPVGHQVAQHHVPPQHSPPSVGHQAGQHHLPPQHAPPPSVGHQAAQHHLPPPGQSNGPLGHDQPSALATGSFRSWAERLFGAAAGPDSAHATRSPYESG
ncbi:hypothetical protein [Candidatus Poriferisodalis sp.]|uniref:hypothetical protein n=1 Tax=Candidatus Poriferisodalis sp. TaxID=3101277 RepID=UPI003B010F9B